MADLGTTNLLPMTLTTHGETCVNCGEYADCIFIPADECYDELNGHYCAQCRTDALIMLRQDRDDPGPEAQHADEQEELLLSFQEFRGGLEITRKEEAALRAWHNELRTSLEMIELVLEGRMMVSLLCTEEPALKPRFQHRRVQ